MHTKTGIKDSYQEHFFNKIYKATNSVKGMAEKKTVLERAISDLPARITSPVWEIPGLDPHQDTPVKILHVGLLGFVKYFWCNLINQLKGKDNKKELLMHWLLALDVSGLGVSHLNGRMLVQYAGSLTGQDFRAIAQCAPFCIHDLVTPQCFSAWQAMSTLVPLIWQPEIHDLKNHIVRFYSYSPSLILPLIPVLVFLLSSNCLKNILNIFLLKTTQWNYQWFNKPKFHILVHLPNHICRFGPAVLFAMELFELYNAVICGKSIHSNWLALSRDIGLAFAQGNRIQHILSSSYFRCSPSEDSTGQSLQDKTDTHMMESYGPRLRNLASGDNTLTSFLGLAALHQPQISKHNMIHDYLHMC